jgi:DNA replication and repair protein RecF
MKNSKIYQLSLFNYRNFEFIEIKPESSNLIIIGENGSGKTNILESISFLSPGRGLRSANIEDVCNKGSNFFRSEFILADSGNKCRISLSYNRDLSRKIIEYNGEKINQGELLSLCKVVWLTPQMEGIFLGPSIERRRFLDRIVYSFIPRHAKVITEYEYYLKERLKLLQMDSFDQEWLNILERKLSLSAVELVKNRLEGIAILESVYKEIDSTFPKARLVMDSHCIDMDVEQVKEQFYINRKLDAKTKRTNFGPHRADLIVYYVDKGIEAKYSSTGEQKAMLIFITIAHVMAIRDITNEMPIMLLDETLVHLDESKRKCLVSFLSKMHAQIWTTSTEHDVGKYFSDHEVIKL